VTLDVPWRDLGRVPARALRLWTRDLPDAAWDETPVRQERYEVHAATRSVLLLWSERAAFPHLDVHAGPRLAEASAALVPVLEAVARRCPGVVVNAVLAELPVGALIPKHVDTAPFFAAARRLHVPLLLPSGAALLVDGAPVPLRASHLVEIDNRRPHAAVNRGVTPRVHLIIDVLPA